MQKIPQNDAHSIRTNVSGYSFTNATLIFAAISAAPAMGFLKLPLKSLERQRNGSFRIILASLWRFSFTF